VVSSGVSGWWWRVAASLREQWLGLVGGAGGLTVEEDLDAHALRRQGWTVSTIARLNSS
jgi:hypothetical protein